MKNIINNVKKEAFLHICWLCFHVIVSVREWLLPSVSSLRSTFCALCVRTSSRAQLPYHVDTASACPASATTGHDTSQNTAPTVRECLLTGLTSVSTAFWQKSLTNTGRLDQRSHPMRTWYLLCLFLTSLVICHNKSNIFKSMPLSCVQVIDVGQMIQERFQKIERLKYSLEIQKVCWKTP